MSNIPTDIKQSLFYTVYFTVLHNAIPLLFMGIIGVLFALILIKPTRSKFLLFSGLVALVFNFEYKKHIARPLLKQTLVSLNTEIPHYKFHWLIEKYILKGVPLILTGFFVLSLLLSVIFFAKERHKRQNIVKKQKK